MAARTPSIIGRTRHRQIADIIVIVTELLLLRSGVLLQRIEYRHVRQHRIAPADQDIGIVAFGEVMLLVDPGSDLLEWETAVRLRLCAAGSRDRKRTNRRGDGGDAERASEQVAPAEAGSDHVANDEVFSRIASNIF